MPVPARPYHAFTTNCSDVEPLSDRIEILEIPYIGFVRRRYEFHEVTDFCRHYRLRLRLLA